MKILIVSDTHGRNHYYLNTMKRVSPIDLVIHLGDLEGGEEYIRSITHCPIEFVSGNNDFFNFLPKEKTIQIGKYNVFLTHGHRYGVNFGMSHLEELAKKDHYDIVMFGHTHMPTINLTDGIWMINPGSLGFPRQQNRIPTFIVMDIDSVGNAHFTLNYYKENDFKGR